jgi:hypothetical protein
MRILAQAQLKPHRLERYMASNDPDFESNAADIIGLYLHPRSMPPCFASMKRRLFRLRIDSPGIAVVAGASGTAWLQIPPPRHAFPLCGAGCENR